MAHKGEGQSLYKESGSFGSNKCVASQSSMMEGKLMGVRAGCLLNPSPFEVFMNSVDLLSLLVRYR